MALTIFQSLTAIGANGIASFNVTGGTEPYTFSVMTQTPGGTINSSTGVYTAPVVASSNPATSYDTIKVVDSTTPKPLTATAKILVGTALLLFCDVIQTTLGLAQGRTYLWDQKIMQPTDSGLYIAVSNPHNKIIGSATSIDPSTGNQVQYVNVLGALDLNIISRGPEARDQKELVVMALSSTYSTQQQNANSFYISQLPSNSGFINLSKVDGAAIPYRYQISVNINYSVGLNSPSPYFNTFHQPTIVTSS